MKERYLGTIYWDYRLPDGTWGTIEIVIPTANYAEDLGMARHCLRKRLKLRRLPNGTMVYPQRRPSR
jgi:hypothetical protein